MNIRTQYREAHMKRIAVLFPGIGYHCDKPLLYFSREIAQSAGYTETVSLRYVSAFANIRGNTEKMREAGWELFAQTEKSLENIVWSEYNDILFISKSVGTAIAAAYAGKIPGTALLLPGRMIHGWKRKL